MPVSLTYLILNAGVIFFPAFLSFDRKVRFAGQWKRWGLAIPFTAVIFIVWDIWKTRQGVWSFNPRYLMGYYLDVLPVEEVIFFFTIPYACLFIYACIKVYFPRASLILPRQGWWALAILATMGAIRWQDKLYTSVNFAYASLVFILSAFRNEKLGAFPLAYILHLVPFFLVNGILTAWPVVVYNNEETLGIRLGTIPLEDTVYSLNLLLTNVLIYESPLIFKRQTATGSFSETH
jgi:lycopene cyclase domain-containing protein